MTEDFEARAALRRLTWEGGVARSFADLEEQGLRFWREAPSGARLDAMWQALVEAWIIGGKHGPPPGFQGSVVGVGRFER